MVSAVADAVAVAVAALAAAGVADAVAAEGVAAVPVVVEVVPPVVAPVVVVVVVDPPPPVLGVVVVPAPPVLGPVDPDPVVVDVVFDPDPVVVDVLVEPVGWWPAALASAASSSARAIGPAVEEPVVLAGWLLTDTATTATGSCAGANATSQSSFVFAVPCCAVPVLAATSTPGIATLGAVPPGWVTPSIRDVTDEAVVAGTARRHGWGL